MSDKVLLITGGSRGIGAATARLAAGAGWAVAVNYTANSLAADEVVEFGIEGLDEARAAALILAARAEEIARLERGA